MLLAAVLCVCAAFMPVKAMASLKVKNIEWEGKGRVELHFRSRVEYGKLRVKVRDAEGNKHTALIRERKSDELEFQVDGLTQGAKYYYTVSGVRRKGSGKWVTVKGSFTVPVYMDDFRDPRQRADRVRDDDRYAQGILNCHDYKETAGAGGI